MNDYPIHISPASGYIWCRIVQAGFVTILCGIIGIVGFLMSQG